MKQPSNCVFKDFSFQDDQTCYLVRICMLSQVIQLRSFVPYHKVNSCFMKLSPNVIFFMAPNIRIFNPAKIRIIFTCLSFYSTLHFYSNFPLKSTSTKRLTLQGYGSSPSRCLHSNMVQPSCCLVNVPTRPDEQLHYSYIYIFSKRLLITFHVRNKSI